jgi:peptide-methionine (R)-S-oxide reductase
LTQSGGAGTVVTMLTWGDILDRAKKGNLPPPRRDERTEEVWAKVLSPEAFQVLRRHGTERPFSSAMCSVFEPGRYACGGCGEPLFDAARKFDSGTGWPSFTAPLSEPVVSYIADASYGMVRVEVRCAICDGHLGHVFPDGPNEECGLRYCINALALAKKPSPA